MWRFVCVFLVLWGCAGGEVDEADAVMGMTAQCPATADCTGRACGPDPICETSCGECADNQMCDAGMCVCVPDCEDRACRPDGCGGICQGCPAGEACVNGTCAPAAACPQMADCSAVECGPDPVCGTDCGACATGRICTDGLCGAAPEGCPDIADCNGIECGPDPVCGTDCGDCPDDRACSEGVCDLPAACDGRVCGEEMGVDCGTCPDGSMCTEAGQCECVPDCDGRSCGTDGCAGVCGTCPDGIDCIDGACDCAARWAAPIDGLANQVFEHDAYVVVLGQRAMAAHVWLFDQCGRPVNDAPAPHPAAGNSLLTTGHPFGDDIVVAGPLDLAQGAADVDAVLMRMTLPDLAVAGARIIDTGPAQSSVADIAQDAQGEFWLAGGQGFFPEVTGRGIRSDGAAQLCVWSPFDADISATHEVEASVDGQSIFLAGTDSPELVVQRYVAADCAVGAACDCMPAQEWVFMDAPGNALSRVAGLAVSEDAIYAVLLWFVNNFSEMRASVRKLPLDDGEPAVFEWDPTPMFDFVNDLVRVPDGVLIAAMRGFAVMGGDPPEALVIHLNDDLGAPQERPVGQGTIGDLSVGRNAVYLLRTTDGQSFVHRCSLTGICAP